MIGAYHPARLLAPDLLVAVDGFQKKLAYSPTRGGLFANADLSIDGRSVLSKLAMT